MLIPQYLSLVLKLSPVYRGSPTYAVFTTANPTIAIFGLCMLKWGIFVLVGDPLKSHLGEFCIRGSQNPCKAGTWVHLTRYFRFPKISVIRGLPVIDRNFITLLTLLGRLLVRNESAHLSSKHFFVRLILANWLKRISGSTK